MTSTCLSGPIRVIHGPNHDEFFSLVGVSVGRVRLSLADAFNVPDEAAAFINGGQARYDDLLLPGDFLEFIKPWGHKAGGPTRADFLDQEFLTLTEAAKLIPGRKEGERVSVGTVWRWRLRGLRNGIKLKSVLIGGQRCTTRQWLQDFIEAINPSASSSLQATATPRTPLQRERESERARQELERLWKESGKKGKKDE